MKTIEVAAPAPVIESIPEELKTLPQWVAWQRMPNAAGKKPHKVPISPHTGRAAKVNDAHSWAEFAEAMRHYERRQLDGVGFVITAGDPYVGVDLDNCREPTTGQLTPGAEAIIHQLDTYTEVSPSGAGVKAICRSDRQPPSRRATDVEIYTASRYFALTGHVLPGRELINERAIGDLPALQQVLAPGDRGKPRDGPTDEQASQPLPVPDRDILGAAGRAKNGPKFRNLFAGNTAAHEEDDSAADLALCRILAFWCGPRPTLIDRLFRQSKLRRDKWDQPHHADGRTYGQATIQAALAAQTAYYVWPNQ